MTSARLAAVVVCASALVACGAAEPIPTVEPAAAPMPTPASGPVSPDDGDAPTPYTAAQIRDACRVGRTYEFLIEKPGAPPVRRRMVFVAVSPELATVESVTLDDKGQALAAPERSEASWEELRRHAAWPRAATTIEVSSADTPAGTFPCKRYTVVEKKDGSEERTVACFAEQLPGPPVELRKEVGGKLVMTMTLLKHDPGTGAR